jgi:hypothetical protein
MSDKPLLDRLQVKRDRRLAVVGPEPGLAALAGAEAVAAAAEAAEVVLLFAGDRAEMDARLPSVLATMRPDAILWLAYPKLTSKRAGDLSRDVIHRAAPEYGLDTVSQIAVDEDWSALRLKRV